MTDLDEILLFETSPYGNVDAIVQHDGRTVYFYLNGRTIDVNENQTTSTTSHNTFGMRAVWVRNLQEAPYVICEEDLRAGLAPMLPRTHMKPHGCGILPVADALRVVWFEEGNGAALVETRDDGSARTLAVIPPWSGLDGFHGYADQCAAESQICWPMPDHPQLQLRIDQAAEFWNSFSRSPDPFATLQSQTLRAYQDYVSRFAIAAADNTIAPSEPNLEPNYYAIDGRTFPPRGLVHFTGRDQHLLATVAMSLCPQPNVELSVEDPRRYRRIELALQLNQNAEDESLENALRGLSSLAAYPWKYFQWLGPGHTVPFRDVWPDCEHALLARDADLFPDRTWQLPEVRNDPVHLLWVLPLDQQAYNDLTAQRLTSAELIQRKRST